MQYNSVGDCRICCLRIYDVHVKISYISACIIILMVSILLSNIRYHGCVFLFYISLCLALVSPVILQPTVILIGDPLSDIWAHIWGNWRTERDILENFSDSLSRKIH